MLSYYCDDRIELRHDILRTRGWWDEERKEYECFISPVVLEELDAGEHLRSSSADVRVSTFRNQENAGLLLEGAGALGGPVFTGNLAHDCGTGISIRDGASRGESHHNTVTGNETGISLAAVSGAPDGGHGGFHSMIVSHNLSAVESDSRSTISFEYSDLPEAWPGQQNIAVDPKFTSEVGRDFSLRAGLPAIAAGKEATDMGAIPYDGLPARFIRGDGDADGSLGVSDVITQLEYLYLAQPGPACLDRLDANDDARIDISDPIFLLFYLFSGGPKPPPPFPGEGVDPTADGIPCQ